MADGSLLEDSDYLGSGESLCLPSGSSSMFAAPTVLVAVVLRPHLRMLLL